MPRPTCIFCSHPATTGEHFWSKWMRPLLGTSEHKHRIESAINFAQVRSPFGERGRRITQGAPEHVKFKIVCPLCNNGWMNRLERARSHMAPLIAGQSTTLNAATQRALAEWIFLKVIVLAHAPNPTTDRTPHPIYSRKQRTEFKAWRTIPDDFRIWIARSDCSQWRVGVRLVSGNVVPAGLNTGLLLPIQRGRNVQAVIWGAGHLAIQTFGNTSPDVTYFVPALPKGVLLWPPSAREFSWPPKGSISDREMWAIADRLTQQMKEIHSPPNS